MRFAAVGLTFASLASLLAPKLAAADTCTAARAMVVLDKSSSMVTGMIGGETKWNVAVDGLSQVLSAYETKAEFGLMTYPKPSECGPGTLDVAPAKANKAAILGALQTPPPSAGNWTPMAQTLLAAADETTLVNAAGAKHVILITDGWQWCSPYDPATRYDGTDAVAALTQKGVTTWIVGFGSEVDAAALNQMAVAAGTQKAACDPTSSNPAAANNCYYQVDNANDLVAALTSIANVIAMNETCDGVDNDCDGIVDEEITRDCSNECGAGVETCHAGAWGGCTAPAAMTCANEEQPDNGDGDGKGGAMHAGCCDAGGAPPLASLSMTLVVGLLLLRNRRRRFN
jgi:hypothetical protein